MKLHIPCCGAVQWLQLGLIVWGCGGQVSPDNQDGPAAGMDSQGQLQGGSSADPVLRNLGGYATGGLATRIVTGGSATGGSATGGSATANATGGSATGGVAMAGATSGGAGGECPGGSVATTPTEPFSFISAGNAVTCGIHSDGTLACWGVFYGSLPASFSGTFRDVSVLGGVCAVRSSGELACWGQASNFSPPPNGAFEQVVINEDGACARRADQTVTCWGNAARTYYAPPEYKMESITGGAYYVCGLETLEHSAVCWEPRVGAESVIVTKGPFTAIDTGRFFACGLLEQGNVSCWSASWPPMPNSGTYGELQPPPGPFRELSVGEFHACALLADGQASCWGNNDNGQSTPTVGGAFAQLSAGSYHTCGVLLDGTVKCWGKDLALICGG